MGQFLQGQTNWKALRVVLLGVLGFIVVLAFIPVSGHRCEREPILRSHTQVRSLAQGAILYAVDHDDLLPTKEQWPGVLIELGIIDAELLESRVEDGDGVSFIYVPGPNSFDETQILIYEDPKHWEEGVIVGFADAHVEIVPHERFEAMLAEQLASQADEP